MAPRVPRRRAAYRELRPRLDSGRRVTDSQIMSKLKDLDAPAKRELAARLGYTERSVYLWMNGKPPKRKAVRAALEKALSGKRA